MSSENSFLNDLVNAVNSGESNSEAAKLIKKISELAENITPNHNDVNELISNSSEYSLPEEYSGEIKKQNKYNSDLAYIIELNDIIHMKIAELVQYADNLIQNLENDNVLDGGLNVKINEIVAKYRNIY